MANWIDARCPNCGCTDEIDVAATIWVRLTRDGSDADASEYGSDHEYGDDSTAVCYACDHSAIFSDFLRPPTLLEALQQALTALNTAPRFRVPSLETNSYKIAAICDAAIKEHAKQS